MKYINIFAYLISAIILIFICAFVFIDLNIFGLKEKFYQIYPNIELRKSVFQKKNYNASF